MTQDTPRLLALLVEAGVRFVVIGGVAAIAHGASTFTRDLDVLIAFDAETIPRLLTALADHDPRNALDPARRPIPRDPASFEGYRNLYVSTDLGRLDLLGETPSGGLDELIGRAVPMRLAGVTVPVIALDDLIAIKRALGRPKDLLVAAELEAIRERLESHDRDP
jgi:hypothetical protein